MVEKMMDFMTAPFFAAHSLRWVLNLSGLFAIGNIVTGFKFLGNPVFTAAAFIHLGATIIYVMLYLEYKRSKR